MRITAAIRAHKGRSLAAALALVALGAAGIYWFGPQYLFIDRRVNEAPPGAGIGTQPADASPGGAGASGGGDETAGGTASGAVRLAAGEFRGLEHDSSGGALVIELPDGSRFLRLEDLNTSNGPDLRVYLSDAPAQDDSHVYDDGAFVDLGALKGNIGSSNYEIPASVDLSTFRSAVVWCRRFSVGFAVAPLDPAG